MSAARWWPRHHGGLWLIDADAGQVLTDLGNPLTGAAGMPRVGDQVLLDDDRPWNVVGVQWCVEHVSVIGASVLLRRDG